MAELASMVNLHCLDIQANMHKYMYRINTPNQYVRNLYRFNWHVSSRGVVYWVAEDVHVVA